MSGGMQQRVGLARASKRSRSFANGRSFCTRSTNQIRYAGWVASHTKQVAQNNRFITHDLDEAMKIGDRIAIMKDGVVEQIELQKIF
jgi:glycine betaine/proline transport system ATP-binding protein